MGRADRLLDLAELLRDGDPTTVGDIARQMAVSPRTVLRDLATLRARGSAIVGESGPGGGIRLTRERGSRTVRFAIPEIVGLWLAASLSREISELPWADAATSGLARLLGSLPAARARDLRLLCGRVIIGPPASAAIRDGAAAPSQELLRVFEEGFSRGHTLTFQYLDRHGAASRRTVEPHGLLVKPPVWYILSRDVEKGEPRAFRMDRISRPRILKAMVFRPSLAVVEMQIPPNRGWRPLLPPL